VYMRARYYNPTLGRFVSEDPAGLQGGLNAYAYCNNDPINCTDPSGMLPRSLISAALAPTYFDTLSSALGLNQGPTISYRNPGERDSNNGGGMAAMQAGLGVASMVPGLGTVAGVANALIDVSQGNYGSAAVSLASAIPFVGSELGEVRAGMAAEKMAASAENAGISAAQGVGTAANESSDVIHVTMQGVALPPEPKYKIPDQYVSNPNPRVSGNYGEIVDGKYRERLAIHPDHGTGRGSHYHLDGTGSTHNSPRPGNPDPGFTSP
jgi:hypothetical protein